ncbi:MAG TPA: metalloregulator ArsR/SmtB family transcription factor [Ktedonobacteraceae bacterium]|nr:metalloregulator ArsR/SmtB family transcription factor [Ktedonobacteraceae bacterium]
MSASNSQYLPESSEEMPVENEEPTKFSSDIDIFVDHFLSLMCDRSRRQILEILTVPNNNPGLPLERRSSDIARELGLTPATTSGHLRQLAQAGILSYRREGNVVYYRLCNGLLIQAFHDLVLALHKEHNEHLKRDVS